MVHFPKKIIGQFFYLVKKTKPGGGRGSEGGLAKDQTFSVFFLLRHLSTNCPTFTYNIKQVYNYKGEKLSF